MGTSLLSNPHEIFDAISTFKNASFQCARAVFFVMRWGFDELTPAIFQLLYLTMVRPQLDYVVQAVAPYLQKDLKLVERMQRLATRCVNDLRGLQYPARLRELQLPSMQSHIFRATLIFAWLQSCVDEAEVDLPGYTMVRADRQQRRGKDSPSMSTHP